MKTIICSAFPGTGKTTLYEKSIGSNLIVLDSDSSKFDKNNFPQNYIKHIKDNIGKANIIFVSSHKEVREALVENCLKFTLIYPIIAIKQEYIDRYKKRGSNDQFVDLLNKNWDSWIRECDEQENCTRIQLESMSFLEHAIGIIE